MKNSGIHINHCNRSASGRRRLRSTGENMNFAAITIERLRKLSSASTEQEDKIIDEVTRKVLSEFSRINHYLSFREEDEQQLKEIYSDLFFKIKEGSQTIEILSEEHYQKLKGWLRNATPYVEQVQPGEHRQPNAIACFEYDASLQLNVLKIDKDHLKSPVLDIGCSPEGYLPGYLHENGLEAYGINRFEANPPFVEKADWLYFDYQAQQWGSIISNLGFSTHFKRHYQAGDQKYKEYSRAYEIILQSLKPGGSFYYAPSLPFIEHHLDQDTYKVIRYPIEYFNMTATQVIRLK